MSQNTVQVLCRYGGEFVWESHKVYYKGGTNRIVRVDQAINYPNLLSKVRDICMSPVVDSIKYKHPNLDLDALVSIENDEDVHYMMQAVLQASQVIQLFVSRSLSAPVVTFSHPRQDINYEAPKATSCDNHKSTNKFAPFPKVDTPCSTDVQSEANGFLEIHSTSPFCQESAGEVVNDSDNDNQPVKLTIEGSQTFLDVNTYQNTLRDQAICGSLKCKETRVGSCFCASNKSTMKIKSLEAKHTRKPKNTETTHRQDTRNRGIDFAKDRPPKHLNYLLKDNNGNNVEIAPGIEVCLDKTRMGKEMASTSECFEESSLSLLAYTREVERSNPGSVVVLSPSSDGSLRLFLAYNAAVHGFIACRQLLMLKSFPIKGKYPCVWLLAMGIDANNNAFPFACAVVKSNDQENWVWFCVELARMLGIMCGMTFVWDIQERDLEAISDIFPNSCQRYFRERLIDTFSEKFECLDSDLVPLFQQATYAYTRSEFDTHMLKICEISKDAREWVDAINPKRWARSHLEGEDYCGWDDFEWEFDTWISNAQDFQIITMMESFHAFMMDLFRDRHQERLNWNTMMMTPFVEEYRFREDFVSENYLVLLQGSATKFEIVSRYDKQIVDLELRTCSCCVWQVRRVPCNHAVAVILNLGCRVYDYCDMCYTVSNYKEAYLEAIHPLRMRIHLP